MATYPRLLLMTAAALLSVSCGNDSSPTEPSTTPPATTLPPSTGSVKVAVVPNPVPFSGVPVTDAGPVPLEELLAVLHGPRRVLHGSDYDLR